NTCFHSALVHFLALDEQVLRGIAAPIAPSSSAASPAAPEAKNAANASEHVKSPEGEKTAAEKKEAEILLRKAADEARAAVTDLFAVIGDTSSPSKVVLARNKTAVTALRAYVAARQQATGTFAGGAYTDDNNGEADPMDALSVITRLFGTDNLW